MTLVAKDEYQYLPDLSDLPDLDLPMELPSLPGQSLVHLVYITYLYCLFMQLVCFLQLSLISLINMLLSCVTSASHRVIVV